MLQAAKLDCFLNIGWFGWSQENLARQVAVYCGYIIFMQQ